MDFQFWHNHFFYNQRRMDKVVDKDRVIMPWGRFKDKYIDEIPSDYLSYVAREWDEDTPFKKKIVVECDREWAWRENNNCHIDE